MKHRHAFFTHPSLPCNTASYLCTHANILQIFRGSTKKKRPVAHSAVNIKKSLPYTFTAHISREMGCTLTGYAPISIHRKKQNQESSLKFNNCTYKHILHIPKMAHSAVHAVVTLHIIKRGAACAVRVEIFSRF